MSVIIFQLMNNYYQDKLSEKRGTDTLYSTFGYFDGLSINMPEISENINNLGHKQDVEFNININRLIVSEYNADCNCRNLVCYTDDEEKNETFWKGSRKALYLFISLVRIEQYTGIETFVQDINKRDNVFCMYSYNHNELAIIYYNNIYYNGMALGIEICSKIPGRKKVYTISAFKESIIEKNQELEKATQDEEVTVQFKCSVKDYDKLSDFLSELGKKINKNPIDFQKYDVLGNDDVLIEIDNLFMVDLLKCYLKGGILNHSNEKYNDCFYNIESQIMKRRRENGQNG